MNSTNTKITTAVTILIINTALIINGQNASDTVNERQSKEIVLAGEDGQLEAIITTFQISENGLPRNGHLVVVPNRELAWVGDACDRYFCFTNAIVGVRIGSDKLIVNRQTNTFKGTLEQKSAQQNHLVEDFKQRLKSGPLDESKTVHLGEKLLGQRSASPFLPPPERVRPAAPASIRDVRFENGELVITLIGEKATVVLSFDGQMKLVKGMINGEVVQLK
jgi:hypothetical protein